MQPTDTAPGQRLFFALWPDAATRAALQRAQQGLAGAGGRPLHPLDLHLTLAFLGQVPAQALGCVDAAADAVVAAPLRLVLDRQGSWPGPRVAWLAPTHPPPGLAMLVNDLWRGLADCGLSPEPRPYRPHVTVSRKAAVVDEGPLVSPIPWSVDAFVLAASRPVAGQPRYEIRRRWALHGETV